MLPSHRRTVLFSHTMMSLAILSRSLEKGRDYVSEPRQSSKEALAGKRRGIPEIVRDDHHTAAERIDRIGQTVDRRDIQPVRRLVQQQHVRPLERQQREPDPALLPLGKRAHQRRLRLAAQAVPPQLLPPVLVVLALLAVLVAHEVERRLRQVELLGGVLAVHAEF